MLTTPEFLVVPQVENVEASLLPQQVKVQSLCRL